MNMEEPQQNSMKDAGEETLVTPRFDAEESVVAQPVVPLKANGRGVARRPRMLPLVLISVLAGGVLGGVGLYVYQSRSSTASAAATEPLSAPVEVAQPIPAPTVEVTNALPQPSPTPVAIESAKESAHAAKEGEVANDANAKAREERAQKESERAPAQSKASDDEAARAYAQSRDKKSADEANDNVAPDYEQRPRRTVYDTQGPIPDDSSPAARRARRVEEGLRRAERARERQKRRRENNTRPPRRSIEGIFEGQP